MRKDALAGRAGKQEDGGAKTREANLGCIFTQSGTDKQGNPLRDPASTSYAGPFRGSRDFAVLLRQEALRRGLGRAQQVVCLSDGAAWIWNNYEQTFPGTLQILDYYHASEYVVAMAEAIHVGDKEQAEALPTRWRREMKESSPEALFAEARGWLDAHTEWSEQRRTTIQSKIDYLQNHASRTRYEEYRARGYWDTSSEAASSKPGAKPSSELGSNNPACSGAKRGPKLSSGCVASSWARTVTRHGRRAASFSRRKDARPDDGSRRKHPRWLDYFVLHPGRFLEPLRPCHPPVAR